MYNIARPETNEYTIGDPPCRGLAPCADAAHQFCTIIVFPDRYARYLYNIYIYIYTYIYALCIYIYI